VGDIQKKVGGGGLTDPIRVKVGKLEISWILLIEAIKTTLSSEKKEFFIYATTAHTIILSTAVITPVSFSIHLLCFTNSAATMIEEAQWMTIVRRRHITTSCRMNFVITIYLRILIYIVSVRHNTLTCLFLVHLQLSPPRMF